jgi:hypothetical protein
VEYEHIDTAIVQLLGDLVRDAARLFYFVDDADGTLHMLAVP